MRKLIIAGLTLVVSSVAVNAAMSKGEAQRLQDAAEVLQELHATPDRDVPQELWNRAECVAVIPNVKKAAFIIGGEYGKGVLSCRNSASPTGWTAPAFMMLAKGSIGFQIGGQSADLVLLVMNPNGVKHLLEDKVALGAEHHGGDQDDADDHVLVELFAGIDLTGGVLKPDPDANENTYGKDIRTRNIVIERTVTAPIEADSFMRALQRQPATANN